MKKDCWRSSQPYLTTKNWWYSQKCGFEIPIISFFFFWIYEILVKAEEFYNIFEQDGNFWDYWSFFWQRVRSLITCFFLYLDSPIISWSIVLTSKKTNVYGTRSLARSLPTLLSGKVRNWTARNWICHFEQSWL